jgi:ADP-heptose:LPS heptosyltransferase
MLGNGALWAANRVLYRGSAKPDAKCVLVDRWGFIGDLLIIAPALAHLRSSLQAGAKIVLMAHSTTLPPETPRNSGAELLREWGLVDSVMYPTLQRRERTSRREGSFLFRLKTARTNMSNLQPDRIVIVPFTGNSPKTMLRELLRLWVLGAPVRPDAIYLHAMPPRLWNAQYDAGLIDHQAVTALRAVGVPRSEAASRRGPAIPVVARARERVLVELGQNVRGCMIAVGCSAKYPHRRWPPAQFRQVIEHISLRYAVKWAILGTRDDAPIAKKIQDGIQAETIDFCGWFDLAETAELMRISTLYLGNETGLAHMGAALGIPTVCVFSGIHRPGIWDPWSDHNITLRADVPCQGCESELRCPMGDMRCLTSISTGSAIAAVEKILREASCPRSLLNIAADPAQASAN